MKREAVLYCLIAMEPSKTNPTTTSSRSVPRWLPKQDPNTAISVVTWILAGFRNVHDHVARQGSVVQVHGLLQQVHAHSPRLSVEPALLVEVKDEAAGGFAGERRLSLRLDRKSTRLNSSN